MEVILLETLRVGNRKRELGDTINVKDGFARNYLIPYGKAVAATKDNLAQFEARRKELEAKAQASLHAAQARANALNETTIQLSVNASEEGKLYGSVGVHEIYKALNDAGQEVEKKEINLPEGPIHEVGEFTIQAQLHTDVTASVKVIISAAK